MPSFLPAFFSSFSTPSVKAIPPSGAPRSRTATQTPSWAILSLAITPTPEPPRMGTRAPTADRMPARAALAWSEPAQKASTRSGIFSAPVFFTASSAATRPAT